MGRFNAIIMGFFALGTLGARRSERGGRGKAKESEGQIATTLGAYLIWWLLISSSSFTWKRLVV